MRVLFSGGGTAGHINPALALAQNLKETDPKCELLFIGTKSGLESSLVPKSGFKIEYIDITGFKRKLSFDNIKTVFRFLTSVQKCKSIIKKFHPDVVVGTGGYVSGPALFAAHRMKIPTAIQEQNAVLGVTTKFLSRFADRIFISFDESRKYIKYPEKIQLCGNPIRKELLKTDYKSARAELKLKNEFFILCFAGSLGAERINDVMKDFIERISEEPGIKLYIATGDRYYDTVIQSIRKIPSNVTIQRYIYNMDCLLNAADLVVSRSGAITISEITALAKPAILVPSPNVTNNHQYHNARVLSQNNAAVLIEEKDLTSDKIYENVMDLYHHPEKLAQMKISSEKLALRNATDEITQGIRRLAMGTK